VGEYEDIVAQVITRRFLKVLSLDMTFQI